MRDMPSRTVVDEFKIANTDLKLRNNFVSHQIRRHKYCHPIAIQNKDCTSSLRLFLHPEFMERKTLERDYVSILFSH